MRQRCYHIEHMVGDAISTTTVIANDGTEAVNGIDRLVRIRMSHWADQPDPTGKAKPASTRSKSRGTRS